MLPDRVSNPGPLTYKSGVLPIALRGPAHQLLDFQFVSFVFHSLSFLFMVSSSVIDLNMSIGLELSGKISVQFNET